MNKLGNYKIFKRLITISLFIFLTIKGIFNQFIYSFPKESLFFESEFSYEFNKAETKDRFLCNILGSTYSDMNFIPTNVGLDSCLNNVICDIDSNIYKIVKIGSQWWMATNLRVSHYNDGTIIPNNLTDNDWSSTQEGAYGCYPHNKVNSMYSQEEQFLYYGLLYNWYAIENEKNLCPSGWHIPSFEEFTALVTFLGGENEAGDKLKLLGTTFWNNENSNVTNDSGFSAIAAGFRDYDGAYGFINLNGIFWSSTTLKDSNLGNNTKNEIIDLNNHYNEGNDCKCDNMSKSSSAFALCLYYNSEIAIINNYPKKYGFSVRCVRDYGL